MNKNSLLVILSTAFILVACTGSPSNPEYATQPIPAGSEETTMPSKPETAGEQGPVYKDALEILPGQSSDELIIRLHGNLPTSCSQLTFTASVAEGSNKIEVVAYSSEPVGKMCAQMLTPFDEKVSIPGLKDGTYDIEFNGEFDRTITIPLLTDVPAK